MLNRHKLTFFIFIDITLSKKSLTWHPNFFKKDKMNYIDIILSIPLVLGYLQGLQKDLSLKVASLVAIILGVYGAIHFSYYISDILKMNSPYLPLISFALTFLIIIVAVYLFAKLLEKSINLLALGFLNKLLGAFLDY